MPKRSNDFQKLVYLVKKHAASGAIVTESKLLRDRNTGQEREVDICIEAKIAGHSVTVSIECRDRGRTAGVQWVEEMKGKHERLLTNALVLVSKSQFTKGALAVARNYGIETTTLDGLDGEIAERLFGGLSSVWSKIFTLSATRVSMRVAPYGDLAAEEIAVLPDFIIYDHEENEVGCAKNVVELILHHVHAVHGIARDANSNHKGFEILWPMPKEEGKILFLKRLDSHVLRPIEAVKMIGSCAFDVSEFPLQHGTLGKVKVAWGAGSHFGKEVLLVASKNEADDSKISVSIEASPTSRSLKRSRKPVRSGG